MTENENKIIEHLKTYGGCLVRISTPFSHKYWAEITMPNNCINNMPIDYNKGVSDDFIKMFTYIKTDHTGRRFYTLQRA